jgi:pimeloyl-ACP methyl ester carboxylesterase
MMHGVREGFEGNGAAVSIHAVLALSVPLQALGFAFLLVSATGLAVAIYLWTLVREALHPPAGGMAFALARGLPSTPDDIGLASRAFTVTCADGATLPVWEVARDASAIDDSTAGTPRVRVVLLHGWGRSRIDSLGRLQPFLTPDSVVYLPDLRGHGDAARGASGKRQRTTLGTREVEDIDRLIAALPPGPVVLAGHSLGATIAIRVAASGNERDRVRGVIAIAPYDTVRTPIGARLAARELPGGPLLDAAMAILQMRGIVPSSTVEAARSLRVPLVVLQGEHDRLSPRVEAEAIVAAAPAGTASLVLFPDTEHADHHLRQPERFEEIVRTLLRSASEHNRNEPRPHAPAP